MEIREATHADIPAIVALLKLSLGESLMPKSERYWHWKHLENPFGWSPVLLCWEGNDLIGVRAFMRWEWKIGEKTYKALRAVDTATHPGHQGKGIFKKLTLSLVEQCQENHDDFIFNTPNHQSKPGYLKMGWQEAGKVPISLSVQRPMNVFRSFFLHNNTDIVDVEPDGKSIRHFLNHPQLASLINEGKRATSLATNVSVAYLKWRYLDVPVANYVAIGHERAGELDGLVIGRIKISRLGRELRITDSFLKQTDAWKDIAKAVTKFKKANAIDFCTTSGFGNRQQNALTGRVRGQIPFGPTVTIRPLGLTDLSILRKFKQWTPSLGDLELF